MFAQLFGFVLSEKETKKQRQDDMQGRILHDRIMAELADGGTIADTFETFTRTIQDAIPFTGIVSWTDGHFQREGRTPTKEQFMALARFLNTTTASEIFATHHLSNVHPLAADYSNVASGVLALPVSRKPRDYLVLFRKAVVSEVQWGGNPDKPVSLGPNGARLTPRKSFEAWKQTVHDQSQPWTEQQIRAAEALRVTLLEVVLRITDSANQERTRSQEQQELLIAELNHRVRNILNLIRGLINQSANSQSVAEFTHVIGGRIHALARAHDQITQENWRPASAHDLIMTEATAYLNDDLDRVTLTGRDAMLTPQAFTTMSLVIHEMMTNAVKYGALSNEDGHVDIRLSETELGDFVVDWSETGGPPVSAPTRKGFGTTITERSIAYELKGTSEVSYDVTGLRARFLIPASEIASFRDIDTHDAVETEAEIFAPPGFTGRVLIVEDNIIIAMDAHDMFEKLGATSVQVASSSRQALDMIDAEKPDFALLDINLGVETSEKVAHRLVELGVRFAFATGYGERTRLSETFPDTPFLRKPYDTDRVAKLL